MTKATERLMSRLAVEEITPSRALIMLLTGVLPEEDIATFRAARTSLDSLIKLLEHTNDRRRNRKISLPRVIRMARDMTNDNWRDTGVAVMVDKDGFVLDGQHRLLAIFASGIKQTMIILNDATNEDQLVTDTGRPRTTGDQLSIRGTTNGRQASAGATLLLRWRAGQIMNSVFQPTMSEIVQLVESTPAFQEAATLSMRLNKHIRHAPMPALVAFYVEATEVASTEDRDTFFARLQDGADLSPQHPILTLRNTWSRYSPDRPVPFRMVGRLWQMIHAWHKWQNDDKISVLRVPFTLTSESFPKLAK